jgi:hypothetical protein
MRTILLVWCAKHGVTMQAAGELLELLGVARNVDVQTECHPAASETGVQACVRLEVDRWGGAAWRNNSGVAREMRPDGSVAPVRYGLANDSPKLNAVFKSSDVIGMAPGGRFLAVECKPRGWRYTGTAREKAQLAFGERVEKLGGVFTFATCVEDVAKAVNK